MPNLITVISKLGGSQSRGKLLGLSQSMLIAAQIAPPLIGGAAVAFGLHLPLVIASLTIFAGLAVYLSFLRERQYR